MTTARYAQLGKIWIRSAQYSALLFIFPLFGAAADGRLPDWFAGSLLYLFLAYLAVWNATTLLWVGYETIAAMLRRVYGVRKARAIGGLLAVPAFIAFLVWASIGENGVLDSEYAGFSLTVFGIASAVMLVIAARCIWIITRPREAAGSSHREVTRNG